MGKSNSHAMKAHTVALVILTFDVSASNKYMREGNMFLWAFILDTNRT